MLLFCIATNRSVINVYHKERKRELNPEPFAFHASVYAIQVPQERDLNLFMYSNMVTVWLLTIRSLVRFPKLPKF